MHKYISDPNRDNCVFFCLALFSLIAGFAINKIPINFKYIWIVSIPSAFSCYGILFQLCNHCLWKFFSSNIIGIPNLIGIWEGCSISDHDNKGINIKVEIKQTWRKIRIVMIAENSRSYSVSAYIYDDSSKLIYNYINEPHNDSDKAMFMHRGTCELVLMDEDTLQGNYYNDRNRKTTGRIELKKT